jgi:hypothetical protein
MAKITEIVDILTDIRALKLKLIKVQDYESASAMREMEKKYLDFEINITSPKKEEDEVLEDCKWCNGTGKDISGGALSLSGGRCPHCHGTTKIKHKDNHL